MTCLNCGHHASDDYVAMADACPRCKISPFVDAPSYATAILAEAPAYGSAFTTSDGIDLEWTTDMGTFESGYAQTN